MKQLTSKYRKDELSPAELQELRNQVNAMPDPEIEQEMYQAWMEEEIDETPATSERMDKIRERIDKTIKEENSDGFRFIRFFRMAAAVLLPVFVALTGYLYYENRQMTSEEMIVTTARGERASVTLPDGTTVSLNSESRLGYFPKTYNKKERKINFNGEGYFQVRKNQEVPFMIDARGLQVKVLGTTFNLLARKEDRTAELVLEEGSVWLCATRSRHQVILRPEQKAILDQATGEIRVITEKDIKRISAWRQGEMVFRNTGLSEVIRTIEKNYHVTVKVIGENCPDDSFTGTLPLTDLNEVLEVIEKSYHLKAEIKGTEIILTDL